MSKRLIYPLFSAPVYVNDVGDFKKPDLLAFQYSSQAVTGDHYNFMTTTDKHVLDRLDFAEIRAIVMREVNAYGHEVLGVAPNIEFYVTNSWINVYRRGQAAGAHIHNNSLISGVLYLKVSETTGDLVFHRDINTLLPFPPTVDLDIATFNIYNCKSWVHRPKTNEICLFPSVVSHSTDPNASEEERACLAFNVFVRGKLGGLHELTIG